MKILIVKLGALGDVINTFPLAIALKQQMACEIHWLVAPLSHSLVARHNCIDKAILFNKKRGVQAVLKTIRQIRETRYDIVFDLQRILKSGCFTLAAKAQRRIGFDKNRCKELSWLFPFERIRPSDSQRHMLVQYMEFLEHLDICNHSVQWDIPRVKKANQIVGTLPEQYLVLNVGATKMCNLWASDSFAELSDQIADCFNIVCVLTGGAEDIDRGIQIQKKAASPMINLIGKTDIHELVEVLANAVGTVSCDTGPMHLASALGTPVISLFGPSNPQRTGPYQGQVIQKSIACSPCNKKRCNAPICMESITPQDVMDCLTLGIF